MQPIVTNNDDSNSPASRDFIPNQLSQEVQLEQLSEHLHLLNLFPNVVNAPFFLRKKRREIKKKKMKVLKSIKMKKSLMTKKKNIYFVSNQSL